jgi:hypothetical protein
MAADFQDCRMLYDRGYYMISLMAVSISDAFDGIVVRFGPAAGKDHFFHPAVEHCSDLSPRFFNGLFCGYTENVTARRVPEMLIDEGQHRLGYSRVNRSGGIVIEIDGSHGTLLLEDYSPNPGIGPGGNSGNATKK